MTQTQNEAEFEFEWLLRQKYEFKILTLIAVLADNNLAYRGTLKDMCEFFGVKPGDSRTNNQIKAAITKLEADGLLKQIIDGRTFTLTLSKSGLYITEIVKRLYQSAKMKELFPDGAERLRHIFANQVYGLAPTEIIYQIAKNFILGFADDVAIEKHNLRLLDSLEYAKTETLEEKLEEVFGK